MKLTMLLSKINSKFSGLQKNKGILELYREHRHQLTFEDLGILFFELSRYRFIHPFSDLEVKKEILNDYFLHNMEKIQAFHAMEILFAINDGLKRNELLIKYVKNYPGQFSKREINLLLEFIYQGNHHDDYGEEQTRKEVLAAVS